MGLPAERRLRRGSDITAAVRRGSRARSGGMVVHGLVRAAVGASAPGSSVRGRPAPAGPRVAFVAPRAVGTAVVRNRTRRRLQGQLTSLVAAGALTADVDLVVRLLPPSAGSDASELGTQLRRGLQRLGVLVDGRA